jgi:hypothetical protein
MAEKLVNLMGSEGLLDYLEARLDIHSLRLP